MFIYKSHGSNQEENVRNKETKSQSSTTDVEVTSTPRPLRQISKRLGEFQHEANEHCSKTLNLN
jgi:hypothetical protein